MDSQKQQVVERLKQANNILVTVSNNPSVDQLAACIGLTLALNKAGKHATAVFSGKVPSTIEFLQPEKTLEKNTNSLQDFIIALDKSKADKLRYKVEDRVVKIFITPYRTSISQADLDFSQGDFNVDVVLTLGVHVQADLDQAITSHGRILHDATVMSINVKAGGELGSINWVDAGASSLSELVVQLTDDLDHNLMDGQIATALLTGIVAETDRFSNEKTSPQTMSISAELMSAGANQQLVATKLEEPVAPPPPPQQPLAYQPPMGDDHFGHPMPETPAMAAPPEPPKKPDDGTIEINHEDEAKSLPPVPPAPQQEPEEPQLPPEPPAPQIHIDEHGELRPLEDNANQFGSEFTLPPQQPLASIRHEDGSGFMTEPPTITPPPLTANAQFDDEMEAPTDPLSLPSVDRPILNRGPLPSQQPDFNPNNDQHTYLTGTPPPMAPATPWQPPQDATVPPAQPPATEAKTLTQLEQDLHSPHLEANTFDAAQSPQPAPVVVQPTTPPAQGNLDDARNAVEQAMDSNPNPTLEPIQALNASPVNLPSFHDDAQATQTQMPAPAVVEPTQPQYPSAMPSYPTMSSLVPPAPTVVEPTNPNAPPDVPPPMVPFPPAQ